MLNLVKNEWMKIFKRTGTYVMIGMLLLIVTLPALFMKYQDSKGAVPDNDNWQKGIEMQNESRKKDLEQYGETFDAGTIKSYEREIAIGEYRIANDLSPNYDYDMWSFVTDASLAIDLVGLFVIIIAAGIVASEFNWGTIKLLLVRPISRTKILASKYITVVLFGIFMLGLLFLYAALLGGLLFGIGENYPNLSYENGKVIETSMPVYLLTSFLLNSIDLLMLSTMAFMISAAFRNSSLAIGLSIFLLFVGGQATAILAMKYSFAKYSLFANTNLPMYKEGEPLVDGMTMGFSITMLIIYFLLFQFIAFYVFKKRDVAA